MRLSAMPSRCDTSRTVTPGADASATTAAFSASL
jgi:hypothetical protein